MSFVPVSGPATFTAADPPRESVVEFAGEVRGEQRVITLPMRAALPALTRALRADETHPSVGLLAGAALLGLQLVADGRFEAAAGHWRPVEGDGDADRFARLVESRRHDDLDPADADRLVRQVVAAVVDAMPRGAPPGGASAPAGGDGSVAQPPPPRGEHALHRRLQQRLARRRQVEELPQLVRISLRVEADDAELAAGQVRLVLQVHDERDPLHVCDAAQLWAEAGHGFGDRARTHASIALRDAATAWPVLDRLLELRVPDEITLDGLELSHLLGEGVAALRERGVDVHWPSHLGRDLTASAVLDRRPAPAAGGPRAEATRDSLLGPDSLFTFNWRLALHGEPLTDDEMDQLAAAASPILKLRGNWTVVDPASARKARDRLLRTVDAGPAVASALTGVVQVGVGDEPADAPVVVGASLLQVRERLLAAATREPLPEPPGLTATLRDYQRHGLTWLADLTDLGLGACLADDMGLGKTVQVIALHLHRAAEASSGLVTGASAPSSTSGTAPSSTSGTAPSSTSGAAPSSTSGTAPSATSGTGGEGQRPTPDRSGGPTLVVCPASLLGNWEDELARFAPGIPVRRFHGTERSLEGFDRPNHQDPPALLEPDSGGFVLTTYGTMRVSPELADVAWSLVVADEAQHVKNARSATARALRRLPAQARVALTGTPVENDLTELWAILDWCTPGLLGSRNAFRRTWAAPIESGHEPTKARQFADLIGPFLLRRRKSDPGIAPELPAKTETDHPLDLTQEQVVLYEAFVRDTMERIERLPPDDPERRGRVLALLTGLKQICNHPAQFLKQEGGRLAGRSEKLELLDELLATIRAEDGAALVFTQYVAMARLIERHLATRGFAHQLLHGGTPVSARERMVAEFQGAQGPAPVFLLSLKAGGTGLNLTRADHVIHYDRWWNPAVEEQATDRAYRIGQTKPVQVHRLVTRGTIESRVAELLEHKRALAESVLGRGEAALTELGNEELRDLVTLRREQRRGR